MIGSIAAIIIVYLYYRSAQAAKKDIVTWCAIGLVAYFIPAVIWTITVTPDLRNSVEHTQSAFMAFIVRYLFVIVASACSLWLRYILLDKKTD